MPTSEVLVTVDIQQNEETAALLMAINIHQLIYVLVGFHSDLKGDYEWFTYQYSIRLILFMQTRVRSREMNHTRMAMAHQLHSQIRLFETQNDQISGAPQLGCLADQNQWFFQILT